MASSETDSLLGVGTRTKGRTSPIDVRTVAIDWTLFGTALAVIILACLPMLLFKEESTEFTTVLYRWLTKELGIYYQWLALGCLVVVGYIAFGRYGKVRLGGQDAVKDYTLFAWMGMLFCSGIGAGLLYWCGIEWAYYLDSPPLGAEPGSAGAIELAATYGIFHWGFSAWGFYALPAVAIAVPYYQRKIPYLRLSTALCGIAGDDIVQRPAGRLTDFFFIVAIVAGTGTSLGLATPSISASISSLFGLTQDLSIDIAVGLIATAMFAVSVYLGLDAGIKRLSLINLGLAFLLLMFVLIVGPTTYILEMGSNSLGIMFQDYLRMSTWTDTLRDTGFVEDWTVFYWAWWLAYAPFMGIFITRISRGRTLREVIVGMLALGTLGCAAFFIVIGNTAMWFELNDVVALKELVVGGQPEVAVATFYDSLPFYPIPVVVYLVLAFIFIATTYDSASYVIASLATRGLKAGEHPGRKHRVFWAFTLIILPITLMYVKDLTAIKNASIIASLPLIVVFVLITISLFKELREDERLTIAKQSA